MTVALLLLWMEAVQAAKIVSAKWRAAPHATISPPRSGHTSALDEQGRVWLFGMSDATHTA